MKSIAYIFIVVSMIVLISCQENHEETIASGTDFFSEGERAYNDERYEEAKRFFTDALTYNKNDADAYNYRGLSHSSLQEGGKAVRDFKKALTLSPQDPVIYYNLAVAYKNLSRPKKALIQLVKGIEIDNKDVDLFLLRAEILYDLNKVEASEKDYVTALQLDSNNAGVRNSYGIFLEFYKYDTVNAINQYTKAIELTLDDLDKAVYLGNRGSLYLGSNQLRKAATDLNGAFAIDEASNFTCYHLGVLHYEKEEYDQAIDFYTKAIELDSLDADAYNERGICYYYKEEYAKALEGYKVAAVIKPTDGAYHFNLGDVYYALDSTERACLEFKNALQYGFVFEIEEYKDLSCLASLEAPN